MISSHKLGLKELRDEKDRLQKINNDLKIDITDLKENNLKYVNLLKQNEEIYNSKALQ